MAFSSHLACLALAAALSLSACGSTYYMVKDPESGRQYYTTDIKHSSGRV